MVTGVETAVGFNLWCRQEMTAGVGIFMVFVHFSGFFQIFSQKPQNTGYGRAKNREIRAIYITIKIKRSIRRFFLALYQSH
jgi:hypothetical protein